MRRRGLQLESAVVGSAAAGAAPAELLHEVQLLQRLHELTRRLQQTMSLDAALQAVLDASIELLGADAGDIQLVQGDGRLMVAARQGFGPQPLTQHGTVRLADAALCVMTPGARERRIISDVDPANGDDELRALAAGAGVRAMQSTPLIGADGRLQGVLSTHWRHAHEPGEPELRLLDLYAQQAVHCIERIRATESLRASEQRYGFLVSLNEATQTLTEPGEIMAVTARMLGEHLGVDRCGYAQIEADQNHFVIAGEYGPAVPSIVGRGAMADFGSEVLRLMRANESYVVNDVGSDPRVVGHEAAYAAIQVRAVICTPLHKAGRFVGCMAVHQTVPRVWTTDEVDLLEIVAARCWDVLERARALQERAESEDRFREMADTSPVLIWRSDTDKAYTWVNRPWCDFVGQPLEALLGNGWLQSVHPDDAARVQQHYGSAFDAREPFSLEFRLRRGDGSYRWLLETGVPRHNGSGTFSGYIGSCIDITERKLAERRLARRVTEQTALYRYTDRLQRASTLSDICDVSLDAICEALRCDRCSVLLTRDGAMRFVAWRDLSDRYRAAVDGHSPWRIDEPAPAPICIEDVSASALPDALKSIVGAEGIAALAFFPLLIDDQLIGKFMVYYDRPHAFSSKQIELALTLSRQLSFAIERLIAEQDQQKAERALLEANQRKDEFLATLAHELRNPLAPIRNSLALLRRQAGDDATFDKARDVLDRQTRHLVRLVDDLLDVSRITQNKLELRREHVDLAAIIGNAIETCMPMIDDGGHRLRVELPDVPLPLDADPMRLAQVFANLLHNAAKYSEPGADITVRAWREADTVLVAVRDTGLGIPAELLSRIFEMFVQGDRSLERSRGGLGIGLTLVQRLVHMHGGSVSVHSEGERRGSEFTVLLPLSGAADTAAVAAPADIPAPPSRARLRILIADDNRDAATSLAEILQLAGHETRIAHDGQTATELAAQYPADVALLDLGMPRLNGYDAAIHIRAQRPDILLIALTGWGQDQDRARSHAAGFDHHLVKPVDLGVLEQLLDASR